MLAAGTLNPMVDIVNKLSFGRHLPHFGPAANMHRLKWSRHLEQHAFMHMEKKGFKFENVFESFENNGLVGFTWTGEIIELAKTVLTAILPWGKLVDALVLVLKVIEFLITCLLLLFKYPGERRLTENDNIAASNALYAHRYEIGCYGKLFYTICMMEGSLNEGRFYEKGIPCSNCTEYCEFREDENGFIEEGNLCEAPKESVADSVYTFSPPITSTLPMRRPKPKEPFWPMKFLYSMPSILFSVLVLVIILLAHVLSK
ncbi:unnamed protein product [Caenorhabditis nigoni]